MRTLILTTALFLCSCTPGYESLDKQYPSIPDELKDCLFYRLDSTNGNFLNVVRCPNSTTTATYKSGKTSVSSVVIDNVEYVRKDQLENSK